MGKTEGQVDRPEHVFASIDELPKGNTCDAIMGILDEGKEMRPGRWRPVQSLYSSLKSNRKCAEQS